MDTLSSKLEFQSKTLKFVNTSDVIRDNEDLLEVTENLIKEGVRCEECRKIHLLPKSQENVHFITLYGNLHSNDVGGLLGNGEWDKYKVPVYHFCPECLVDYIRNIE